MQTILLSMIFAWLSCAAIIFLVFGLATLRYGRPNLPRSAGRRYMVNGKRSKSVQDSMVTDTTSSST